MANTLEDYQTLKDYIHYDPVEGSFKWIRPTTGRLTIRKNIGSVMLNGYLKLMVNRKSYLAHRAAWFLTYGYIPKLIDHVDGNKLNNKISNLREATKAQNAQNSTVMENASGVRNVTWIKCKKRWRARFLADNNYYVKTFKDLESAADWAREMKTKLHGEFANYTTYKNNVLDYSI